MSPSLETLKTVIKINTKFCLFILMSVGIEHKHYIASLFFQADRFWGKNSDSVAIRYLNPLTGESHMRVGVYMFVQDNIIVSELY